MFKKLEETSKNLIYISLLLSAVFGILGVVIINDHAPYAKSPDFLSLVGGKLPFLAGLAIGECFTVVKIMLIDRSCKKVLEMDSGMGKLYGTGQYFTRFMLTAAVLVAAMLITQVSFLGCLLGIFTLQLAGYMTPFVEKKRNADITKQ